VPEGVDGLLQLAAVAVSSAPAALAQPRDDYTSPCQAQCLPAPGTLGCGATRNADIAGKADASRLLPVHSSEAGRERRAGSTVPLAAAHKPVVGIIPDQSHTTPRFDVPVRSPLFSRDLLHHFDFQLPLRQQLLEPGILLLQCLEMLDVIAAHVAKPLAPTVDALLADSMALGNLGIGALSASRNILTICSSLYRLFFIAPFLLGAIFSNFYWSENPRTGHALSNTEA
jgi:hypothetical protein